MVSVTAQVTSKNVPTRMKFSYYVIWRRQGNVKFTTRKDYLFLFEPSLKVWMSTYSGHVNGVMMTFSYISAKFHFRHRSDDSCFRYRDVKRRDQYVCLVFGKCLSNEEAKSLSSWFTIIILFSKLSGCQYLILFVWKNIRHQIQDKQINMIFRISKFKTVWPLLPLKSK